MTDRQAFLRLRKRYPDRTFDICTHHWHNEGIGNRIGYRVTIFDASGKDCTGYDGKTLEECLMKIREAESKPKGDI
jgi:hypothetical protein